LKHQINTRPLNIIVFLSESRGAKRNEMNCCPKKTDLISKRLTLLFSQQEVETFLSSRWIFFSYSEDF
jgi:hypothetical protein